MILDGLCDKRYTGITRLLVGVVQSISHVLLSYGNPYCKRFIFNMVSKNFLIGYMTLYKRLFGYTYL
jgi:hypothetical protein